MLFIKRNKKKKNNLADLLAEFRTVPFSQLDFIKPLRTPIFDELHKVTLFTRLSPEQP